MLTYGYRKHKRLGWPRLPSFLKQIGLVEHVKNSGTFIVGFDTINTNYSNTETRN
jgi:hypothetical protein